MRVVVEPCHRPLSAHRQSRAETACESQRPNASSRRRASGGDWIVAMFVHPKVGHVNDKASTRPQNAPCLRNQPARIGHARASRTRRTDPQCYLRGMTDAERLPRDQPTRPPNTSLAYRIAPSSRSAPITFCGGSPVRGQQIAAISHTAGGIKHRVPVTNETGHQLVAAHARPNDARSPVTYPCRSRWASSES